MKNKRITLVSIGTSRKEYPYLPGYFYCTSSGIHYVNALLLTHGFDTTIVNMVTDNLTVEEVPDKIRESNPDIVLFNQFFIMRDRVRTIVGELGDNYIYGIGGHDATFHALSLVDDLNVSGEITKAVKKPVILQTQSDGLNKFYSGIDFIWLGEAENGIADLMETIDKQQSPLLVYNLHNRVMDLDTLPVLTHDDYNSDVGFIVTSRGCMKMGCEFCTTPQFYPDGWRARSIQHVEEELRNLSKNGKRYIYACDDSFLGFNEKHLEKAMRVLEIMESLKLKCFIMTSVSQVLKAEEMGLLEKMTGTVTCVFLGVENPVASSLQKFGKNVRHEESSVQSARAIETLVRWEIMPFLGYINFQPDTTLEELWESARFLYETNMEASYFHYLYNRLNILEGTPLYNKFKNSPQANFDEKTGELVYEFNDNRVREINIILNSLINDARQIDHYNYETGFIIFSNKLLKTNIGLEYYALKRQLNDLNYNFFINILKEPLIIT